MSEIKNNQEDLNDIINNIENIFDEPQADVPLFQNMKIETPFKESKPVVTVNNNKTVTSEDNNELTVIGSATIIDSNITCGGNMEVKGQVKGKVVVAGGLIVFGNIDGDVEASELRIENGAKINGNIICKNDVNLVVGANLNGNMIAKTATIASNVVGNIEIGNEITIASTGSIIGNIAAGSISVENGAVLNGNIQIKH